VFDVRSADQWKTYKQAIVERHTHASDLIGLSQSLATLLPIAALWYCVHLSAHAAPYLIAGLTLLMSLFLLRGFVLMHECGHGSLFRSATLNKSFGFIFGVLSGMPQQVWAKNHLNHHATNGNWEKYAGPLSVISVLEYVTLTPRQQRSYRRARSPLMAPIAGFLYFIVQPRLTWIRATGRLAAHAARKAKLIRSPQPTEPVFGECTPYCTSLQNYRHMLWNNVVLLSLCGAVAWTTGPLPFLACYLIATSLAGGLAIVLFTVQHNFEHSYASGNENWDKDLAAIEGTSMLVLPRWLNWLTVDIAYHHVHHLCARVPNYRLADCHEEMAELFATVTRLGLADIPRALKYVLWDTEARRLVSVAELGMVRG
jgi:omega-6 fatty acid desaturase (delta-12 desaturase)